MSSKYHADESTFDWFMCVVLEHYESLPAISSPPSEDDDRIIFLRRFMEQKDGKWVWKSNENNEWGDIWVDLVDDYLEDCMPKSLRSALLADIINDYSCREDGYNDTPIFVNEIKDLATDDWQNPDDERCGACGKSEGHQKDCSKVEQPKLNGKTDYWCESQMVCQGGPHKREDVWYMEKDDCAVCKKCWDNVHFGVKVEPPEGAC